MTKNKNIRCQFCNWLNLEVLDEFVCSNCGKNNFLTNNKKDKPQNVSWLNELQNIKGIGQETVEDIDKIYNSRLELEEALKNNKVPLRNDVVKKLKEYFNE